MNKQSKSPEVLQDQLKIGLSWEEQELHKKYSEEILKIVNLNDLPEDIPGDLKTIIKENKDHYYSVLKWERKNEKKKRKEEIEFVFKQNPELAEAGSPKEYSQYLYAIFPESKLRDIFWHGAKEKFDEFDLERGGFSGRNFGKGCYVTPNFNWASQYAMSENGVVLPVIVNIADPFITDHHYKDYYGAHYSIPRDESFKKYITQDAIVNYESLDRDLLTKKNDFLVEYRGEKDSKGFPVYQKNIRTTPKIREVVLPEIEQTHILGSRKDINGFKEFIEKLDKR
jgi:hypothetical protein